MSEFSKLNIYQKMSAISNEIKFVKKALNVSTGKNGNSYTAVGEGGILDAVKPAEEKFGVYSFPFNREIVHYEELPTAKQYYADGTPYDKCSRFLRLKTTYRFVNLDKTDEYIDMVTYADGLDSGDKAPGKAETYCDKYALMKAYKIITGDDPDQFASVSEKADNEPVAPSKEKPASAPVVKEAKEPAPVDNNDNLIITADTAKAMDELKIDPERLAAVLKKDVNVLTEEDCANAVATKRAKLAERAAKKAAMEASTGEGETK